jgi:hypothetical protein
MISSDQHLDQQESILQLMLRIDSVLRRRENRKISVCGVLHDFYESNRLIDH